MTPTDALQRAEDRALDLHLAADDAADRALCSIREARHLRTQARRADREIEYWRWVLEQTDTNAVSADAMPDADQVRA